MVVILEYIPFGSSFLTSCKNYGRLKIPKNLIIRDRRPALVNITVILLKTKNNSKLFREMKFNILEKKSVKSVLQAKAGTPLEVLSETRGPDGFAKKNSNPVGFLHGSAHLNQAQPLHVVHPVRSGSSRWT